MSMKHKTGKKQKAPIHCPVSGCLYFYGSDRFFSEKKFLNQHIAKVHAEKKYPCGKCQKMFGMDWWRRHHEKTCGTEWKCECGCKYASWESLLTHSKRRQHKLPQHLLNSDKISGKEPQTAVVDTSTNFVEKPVIVLIQPIIQNWTCIQPTPKYFPVQNPALRPILPKTMQPSVIVGKGVCNPVYSSICDNSSEKLTFSCLTQKPVDESVQSRLVGPVSASANTPTGLLKPMQKTISTQTEEDVKMAHKSRESRGSQCARRRKSKATSVGIESTHTQTAESAVIKIKKRRTRRKSVAIITEPSAPFGQDFLSVPSLWSDFKDLILPNGNDESLGKSAIKSSTSTQTGASKVLCDSQTITDDDLFSVWDAALKEKVEENTHCCTSSFAMLPDITTDDSLLTLTENMSQNDMPDILDVFSSNNPISDVLSDGGIKNENLLSKDIKIDHHQISESNFSSTNDQGHNTTLPPEACTDFSVFEDCAKSVVDVKDSTKLSDIHTQTMGSSILDYNLLAHMETQTTDDFPLYDLEFSDTETQTPWDDFPNFDDSPLPADQLSIEIQTDFSSLSGDIDKDPFGFMSDFNLQNMLNACSNKESSGVNSETQTYDGFTFPEVTNSESQTLDISSFFCAK